MQATQASKSLFFFPPKRVAKDPHGPPKAKRCVAVWCSVCLFINGARVGSQRWCELGEGRALIRCVVENTSTPSIVAAIKIHDPTAFCSHATTDMAQTLPYNLCGYVAPMCVHFVRFLVSLGSRDVTAFSAASRLPQLLFVKDS